MKDYMKSLIYCLLILLYSLALLQGMRIKHKQSVIADLYFEYPYTCGTWFNRGKNTCNDIREVLEKHGIKVYTTVKPYHVGEFPPDYNGFFNIYLNTNGEKRLIATSDESKPQLYHSGLKYFAYTFYKYENGEKNYFEEYPQKKDLMDYMLKKVLANLA